MRAQNDFENRNAITNLKKRKSVNNQSDELIKTATKSVTRRTALKRFSGALSGMMLAIVFALFTHPVSDCECLEQQNNEENK